MDLLDRLMEHDQWATTQLLNISKKLTSEQQSQEFDVGHKSIGETFQHMIVNIEVWTSAMLGQQPTFDDVPSLSEWYERAYATFSTVARQIRDEQRLEDTFTDQFGAPMTFGGAIVHVILHNEGHRVEVLHILQRLGVPDLPEIDHGLWDFVRRGLFESS